jgi:transposase
MDTLLAKPAPKRTRRKHDAEFRAQVIEACLHPGVSVAGVALANGLNANMLRKWVREQRHGNAAVEPRRELPAVSAAMVPVTVAPGASADIRIDVRRGGTTVQLAWPLDAVTSLGPFLRDLLR